MTTENEGGKKPSQSFWARDYLYFLFFLTGGNGNDDGMRVGMGVGMHTRGPY